MAGLSDYVPNADALIALHPEDLGMILLQLAQSMRGANIYETHFTIPLFNMNSPQFPHHRKQEIMRAVAEAWQWMQNEGLLMHEPDTNGLYCVTKKGAAIKSAADQHAYRHGNLLPVALLHPKLAEKVRPMFMRGDYDVAVFQAFKDIEVAVRKASKLTDSDIGRKLMQTAFRPEGGPLTVVGSDKGEQVGLMDLFSGAIGYCKNPASHRSPGYIDIEAAQLIAFASFLLNQVEEIVASRG
jgi:uncharacterized protein (TIGR02391 family)